MAARRMQDSPDRRHLSRLRREKSNWLGPNILESVRGLGYAHGPTGVFFEQQIVDSIIEAVGPFERNLDGFSTEHCRSNALRFSQERFRTEILEFGNRCLERYWRERRSPLPHTRTSVDSIALPRHSRVGPRAPGLN